MTTARLNYTPINLHSVSPVTVSELIPRAGCTTTVCNDTYYIQNSHTAFQCNSLPQQLLQIVQHSCAEAIPDQVCHVAVPDPWRFLNLKGSSYEQWQRQGGLSFPKKPSGFLQGKLNISMRFRPNH